MSDNIRTWIDPGLPWQGRNPYAVLAPLGLHPDSDARAVLDASYDLPEGSAEANSAWEALRTVRGRLLVDFFCHQLPPGAEPDAAAPAPACHLPQAFLRELVCSPPPGGEPDDGKSGRMS